MRRYGDTVYLEAGETVPLRCRCGALYQPPAGSERSLCCRCGRWNDHEEQTWEKRTGDA